MAMITKYKFTICMAVAMMLSIAQQADAQSKKDFETAMQTPRGFAEGYRIDRIARVLDFGKCREKAEKYGYVITPSQVGVYFIPQSEYDAWMNEACFAQGPARGMDAIKKDPSASRKGAEKLLSNFGIEKKHWVNRNLKGSDFKSTGAVYYLDGDKLVRYDNAKWTGEVKNGLIDGEGDGFVVVTDANQEKVYRSFSGSFKDGLPHGDVTYALMSPLWDPWNFIFAHKEGVCLQMDDFHDGMAKYRHFGWYYASGDNDEKRYDKNFGFISQTGQIAIGPAYSEVKRDFANGKATVTLKGLDIVINKKGEFQSIAEDAKVIPKQAFYNNTNLESIVIPNSVTEIGDEAFSGCTALKQITLPPALTKIGKKAFSGCKRLTAVSLPGSITSIGDNAFMNCENLASATVAESLVALVKGKKIFDGCTQITDVAVRSANGDVVRDNNWYWKLAKDPEEDIQRYEAAAKASGEGLTAEDFFTILTKNDMQDIRAYLEARKFQPGENEKSNLYTRSDVTDWSFGYKLEWDPISQKWLRRSASDFLLLTVSYDNGKKRIQAVTCHFPYTALKDAFMKTAPQKQYSIDKPLTFLSRTTFTNKDKDRIIVYMNDDGSYYVEFEKYYESIFESFGESIKRDREYYNSLGK